MTLLIVDRESDTVGDRSLSIPLCDREETELKCGSLACSRPRAAPGMHSVKSCPIPIGDASRRSPA